MKTLLLRHSAVFHIERPGRIFELNYPEILCGFQSLVSGNMFIFSIKSRGFIGIKLLQVLIPPKLGATKRVSLHIDDSDTIPEKHFIQIIIIDPVHGIKPAFDAYTIIIKIDM